MEKQNSEKMPDLKKASPGPIIKVEGNGASKGLIINEELPKSKEFAIKLVQRYKS
ncbi:MAG: hypothetical protein ACFFG0_38070 [Candidatus Thorarchaeota archaeon]